jgi:enoyl-CoA hydratase
MKNVGGRLQVDAHDGVARVMMARPPVNAIDGQMLHALTRVFEQPDDALGSARVVVFGGEGRCFSAGHDRNEPVLAVAEKAAEHLRAAARCVEAITALPVPTIAAVHGAAIGVGLILAASCSVSVFADNAILQLPERQVGIAAGTAHAQRLLPPTWARWLVLSGERIRAHELTAALPVVAAEELHDTVTRVAADIARSEPALTRLLATQLRTAGLVEAYTDELLASLPLLAGPPRDHRTGEKGWP